MDKQAKSRDRIPNSYILVTDLSAVVDNEIFNRNLGGRRILFVVEIG